MLEHIKTVYKIVEVGKNGEILEIIEEFQEREKAEEYMNKTAKEENHKRLMIDEEEIFL